MTRILALVITAAAFVVLVACATHPQPAPEPATQQIVYMAPVKLDTLGPQGSELVMMNLDGTDSVQLTDNATQEFLPHFSPDATKVAYTKYTTGSYGVANETAVIGVVDVATLVDTELTTGPNDGDAAWSPDGKRIAYLSQSAGVEGLWIMNADGSDPQRVGGPTGSDDDEVWGDIAWSSDDWILFVVAQGMQSGCFKTRLDKIRPDGSTRTQLDDGGPSCTPAGMEQSGDADPAFSADGKTIYSSRGMPSAPAGSPPAGTTERKLYALSSDAWTADKPEQDLSLPSEPACIEGVPKGSPDGTRVLEYRACFYEPNERAGVYVTDTAGSYRTYIADGFGPDWNPLATQ
jgi:Tol biopolymer transport system component